MWPKLPVFGLDFQCRPSPGNLPPKTLQPHQKSPSAVTKPSALERATRLSPSDCWCWAHSRKSREPPASRGRAARGCRGRARSSSPPQILSPTRRNSTQERHPLRTSTERQQPLLMEVRNTSRDTSIYSASRSPEENLREGSQPSEPGSLVAIGSPGRLVLCERARSRTRDSPRPWLAHGRRHGSLWAAGPRFLLRF
jgi:hypothetical protein